MAKNNGMSFSEWSKSRHNPISDASELVRYFMKDALKDAFEAGILYEKRLHREARKHHDENVFEDHAPL